MFALIFSILWTVGSTALILVNFDDLVGWERGVVLLFPLAGLFATHSAWLARRRRRSLRVETRDGTTWYVWVELDGSERRSTRDPRDDWDSDGDGGGDGGGD
ncbi:hypothetical protein HKCCSP123_11780 [Rhodobacterales bacterium HKCCSP123]|nr:hypothetical protein [Rhodobacterales bacterium HKCCSP123]